MPVDFMSLLGGAGDPYGGINPNLIKFLGTAGAAMPNPLSGGGAAAAQAVTEQQMQRALAQMFSGQGSPTVSTAIKPTPATATNPVSMREQKAAGLSGADAASLGGQATSQLATHSGLTPPDQPGMTSIKRKPDGSYTLDFTPEKEGTANASPFHNSPAGMGIYSALTGSTFGG